MSRDAGIQIFICLCLYINFNKVQVVKCNKVQTSTEDVSHKAFACERLRMKQREFFINLKEWKTYICLLLSNSGVDVSSGHRSGDE